MTLSHPHMFVVSSLERVDPLNTYCSTCLDTIPPASHNSLKLEQQRCEGLSIIRVPDTPVPIVPGTHGPLLFHENRCRKHTVANTRQVFSQHSKNTSVTLDQSLIAEHTLLNNRAEKAQTKTQQCKHQSTKISSKSTCFELIVHFSPVARRCTVTFCTSAFCIPMGMYH